MILIQKQTPALLPTSMSSLSHSHRRHPSAPPAVIVQPTKTPGLLSLSKPVRPSTPRSHAQPSRQQRAAPRAKTTPNRAQRPPAQANIHTAEDDKTSTKLTSDVPPESKAVTVHNPEKNNRGRSQNKFPKDKGARRSASHSTVRISSARRQAHHQPSPPAPDVIPSQAEAPFPSLLSYGQRSSVNSFDPFVVSDDSDASGVESITPPAPSATPVKPKQAGVVPSIPKLNERPSGRLARRRQPAPRSDSPTPSKSKAKTVPVPRAHTPLRSDRQSATLQLSRSDPILSNITDRPSSKRYATTYSLSTSSLGFKELDSFPVCDDTDDGDSTTAPSTPVREGVTWQQSVFAFDEGPRTAPLSAASGWPFGDQTKLPVTPPKQQRPRYHRRAPSEGMFHMSSDDEAPSNSPFSASKASKSMSALLKRQSLPSQSAGPRRGPRGHEIEEEEKAPYFASSMFQNSPSPEDLPAPTFGARF